MTQDEVIEIAQECNLIGMRPHLDGIYSEALVAFANLVADKATEEANAIANASWTLMCKKMVAFEREACAVLCEALQYHVDAYGATCAEAIRARGEQALAQPEQAPVKWSDYEPDGMHHNKQEQDTIQRLSALVRAQQIIIDKLEARQEQLREENERLHVENRRLIDRIETIGVPVGLCCHQYDTCLKPCTPRGRHLAQRTWERPWVSLTDEEKSELWEISRAALPRYATYASLVEAKLKEKNT